VSTVAYTALSPSSTGGHCSEDDSDGDTTQCPINLLADLNDCEGSTGILTARIWCFNVDR
jgi:hypothetical protein